MTGMALLIIYLFILVCLLGYITWKAGKYERFYEDDVNMCVLSALWPIILISLIFISPFYLVFRISKRIHNVL